MQSPAAHLDRDVFQGVHREVRAPLDEAMFQLLDEQPLAPEARERGIQPAIRLGPHRDQLDAEPGVVAQELGPGRSPPAAGRVGFGA